jgi:hypothetical protein
MRPILHGIDHQNGLDGRYTWCVIFKMVNVPSLKGQHFDYMMKLHDSMLV